MLSLNTDMIGDCSTANVQFSSSHSSLIWPSNLNSEDVFAEPFSENDLKKLKIAIQMLTPKQQRTLTLFFGFENAPPLSKAEISRIEGISKPAVAKRIDSAIAKLTQLLV